MDGGNDDLLKWAENTLKKTPAPAKADNPQAREKILRASQSAKKYGYDIPDDVADEFYELTAHESGRSHYLNDGKTVKTGARTPNGDVAIGFSQVMGNTAKPYQSKGLDPYKEDDNLIIGLNEFFNGDKTDPVGRRLAYVGGGNTDPKRGKINLALAKYRRTGEVSEGKLYSYLPNNKETFADYVKKSGGYKKLENWAEQTLNGGPAPDSKALTDWADGILQSSAPSAVNPTNEITATPDQRAAGDAFNNLDLPKGLTRPPTSPTNPVNVVPQTLPPEVAPPIADEKPLTLTGEGGKTSMEVGAGIGLNEGEKRVVDEDGRIFIAKKTIAADGTESYSMLPQGAEPEQLPADYLEYLKVRELPDSNELRNEYSQVLKDEQQAYDNSPVKNVAQASNVGPTKTPINTAQNGQNQQALSPVAVLPNKAKTADDYQEITRDVIVPKGVSVRQALNDSTQKILAEAGIDAESSDIEAAAAKSRITLENDGSIATDTTLEKYRDQPIPNTVAKSFVREVLKAKEERLKKQENLRQSILTRTATGDKPTDAELREYESQGVYLKDIPKDELDTATNEGELNKQYYAGAVNKFQKNAEKSKYAYHYAALETGRIDKPELDKRIAFQDVAEKEIRAEESSVMEGGSIEGVGYGIRSQSVRPRTKTEIETAVKNKLDAINKNGSIYDYVNEIGATKDKGRSNDEKYRFRPLAQALEGAKTFYKAPFKAASSALKSISIAAEAIDYSLSLKDKDVAAKDRGFYRAAVALDKLREEVAPSNKDFEGEIQNTFIDTFGQLATQIIAGTLTGGAALPTLLGAAQGIDAQYTEAEKFGATREQKFKAAALGGLLAAPDYFIFKGWFKGASLIERSKFLTNLKQSVTSNLGANLGEKQAAVLANEVVDSFVRKAAKQGVSILKKGLPEGIQEPGESKGNDLYAYLSYDPSPERRAKVATLTKENITEGVAGFFGGILGASFSAMSEKAANLNTVELASARETLSKMSANLPDPVVEQAERVIDEALKSTNSGTVRVIKKPNQTAAPTPNILAVGERVTVPDKTTGKPLSGTIKSIKGEKIIVDTGEAAPVKYTKAEIELTNNEKNPAPVEIPPSVESDNVLSPSEVSLPKPVNEPLKESAPNTDESYLTESVKPETKPQRNFRAGTNDATLIFNSERQRDLYDLAAKEKYLMRGGQNSTSDRTVGDIAKLKRSLIESGIGEKDLSNLSRQVYDDVRAQMKGVKHLEERQVKDNVLGSVTKPEPLANPLNLTEPQPSAQNANQSVNSARPANEKPSAEPKADFTANGKLRGRTQKAVGAIFGKSAAATFAQSGALPAPTAAPAKALKKIVTQKTDEHQAYQQRLADTADKIDLISDVETSVKGDEVQLSLEAAEIARIIDAAVKGEDIETASLVGGLYVPREAVADYVEVLTDLADVAEQNGISRKPLDDFRANILEAVQKNGTAILSVYPEAVPHERLHQSRDLNSGEKAIVERYENFDKVFETATGAGDQSINQKAFETYFKRAYFADKDFTDLSDADRAELHEETFTATARGDYELLGLTDEEAARFLEADLDSYVARNGDKILDDIEEYFDERTKPFDTIRKIRERRIKRSDAETDSGIQSQESGKPERDTGLRKVAEGETGSGASNGESEESEKLKTRQTVVSAENAGIIEKGAITGEARYYTATSRETGERAAQERIERDGLAKAFADAVNPNTAATAEHAALQLETVKLLNRQADEATKAGHPAAAKAKLNQSVEIMLTLAPEGTKAGQFISQLASMNKTDPDTVAGYVQKRRAQKQYSEPLTPEQSAVLRETARALQVANEKLADLETKTKELSDRLGKTEQKESVETKTGKTKPLSSVEKSLVKDLQSKAEKAAQRLKDKFGEPSDASKRTLKMAMPPRSPIIGNRTPKLDAETLQDLTTVGAEMLLTGLKGNPISVIEFRKSLLEQFGEAVRPHLAEIHAVSVKELKNIKSEAYRARAVETLRDIEGNEDLTIEDLNAIVEGQIAERKEKSKIRAEHKTEADKFFNSGKAAEKETARETKERAKADLPSFAKSLFKVAAAENKEILLGAFYLETGQVKTANELARKLREAFPNLSPQQALNASSLAARARLLAHKDLQTERGKIKAEKEKTEGETEKARKERNLAQRVLLNRIASLEKPPLGYLARTATIYKAALVSAVQTTVNNILTAEGTRKIVSLTDLAEISINKTLRAVGKEYDYKNKLSSDTRLMDVLGLPDSENYNSADVAKHFFTDAVFARSLANSVLDEYPTLYEAMFGSYASDVEIMAERGGADKIADRAMQAVEKTYNAVNSLNQLQEFLVRSQEFNYALQIKLGQKGLNLTDVVKNRQIVEKISEEDLSFAVNRALRVTFALKPDQETNFGKLANLYQSAVPSVLSPFLITFPNFLYNATKFVTDYAPVIGIAKAGYKATTDKNNSLGKSLKEEINPRVISQQLVGTALYLAALGLVRAAGDDDKWYYLRIPGTEYYIDVRGYQPFASMIFLANKTNRLLDGKPMFTDRETAAAESLEAMTGLSTRNLTENKIGQILWRGTLGREGDGKDWERVSYLFKQQLGEIGGGFLRPLKTVKDIVAQFDEYEAKIPDTIDRPGSQGLARSLPFANRLLQLEPKKDFVTGKESSQPAPILKVFGVSIVNPDFHKEVPSRALVAMREMTDNFKSEKDVLPESQRKAAIKSSLYRAMREAGDDAEKQKKVSGAIKRAEERGLLEAGEIEFIERQKGLSELENLSKKMKFQQIGRAFKVATDAEKAALENIVQSKAEGANKRRDLTAQDVAAINKFLPDFQIDLKTPITIYEKVKSATTDESVEMYLEKESELSDGQKDDFKSFIKQKAENANKAGKLTDAEIENIKKVLPDFKVTRRMPSSFKSMPSRFGEKFDSLKVKN